MMWLTWRQFRTQAIVTIAGLALVAIVLVITGLQLAHRFDASGITGCHPHTSCEQIANAFLLGLKGTVPNIVLLIAVGLTYLVPGLIGVFWGAPLHHARDRDGNVQARVDPERDEEALAGGQGGPDRTDCRGGCWPA